MTTYQTIIAFEERTVRPELLTRCKTKFAWLRKDRNKKTQRILGEEREEKECREDMSQRGERGCQEKGSGGQGWEERSIRLPKSHGFFPFTSFHSPFSSPHAFNGQIRDKRARVETVVSKIEGDPSIPKCDRCTQKERTKERQKNPERVRRGRPAWPSWTPSITTITLSALTDVAADTRTTKPLSWGQTDVPKNFAKAAFLWVEIFQPSIIKEQRISCQFICKWAPISDSSLKGVNAARCG